ncbi:MAG: bifunctional (p)ppGpp synthetase/guanosine-3',5'-bis(diphosphate) 3'-pyrophosphohydrolase [Spirochaetae bacterium HGW-Spirochaetae-5]|nr:MAG: bifunctional (p)ppGpp synthetase/guanosine-3',5'-bis(diphosphate) 3'-pyrophosphohydrolase [Spirochaetae bacterium HGW-Spirochaetae-5]
MNNKTIWSQDLYLKAIRFAGDAHKNQKIPGSNLPYIIHLSNVCMEVMAAVCSGETRNPDLAVICAVLHDTIEDAGVTADEVEQLFGKDISAGVLSLTKNSGVSKELRMAESIERIKLQPKEIWMVKLADRITNLQPPPSHWTDEKISSYRKEAEYILEQLGSASALLRERLAQKIKNYP